MAKEKGAKKEKGKSSSKVPDKVEEKQANRAVIIAGAVIIQLLLGALYAYSTFAKPISAQYTSDPLLLQLPFAVALATFAVAMVIAGRWQDKAGPRVVATVGGVVFGIGILLAAFVQKDIYQLAITYGVVGGAGIGLAYVCPIAALVKWFPDKKGLITGIAVFGFGAGALITANVANPIMAMDVPGNENAFLMKEAKQLKESDYEPLIKLSEGENHRFNATQARTLVDHAKAGNVTKDDKKIYAKARSAVYDKYNISKAFMVLGGLYLIGVVLAAQTLRNPPPGYKPKGWNPPAPAPGAQVQKQDYSWKEMIKTHQFYLVWLMYCLGATAGLMIIGNVGTYASTLSIGAAQIAVIVGVLGLFNASGRIVWGWTSDKIGRTYTLLCMYVLSGLIMLVLYKMTYPASDQSFLMLTAGASVIGFCFGGNLAMFPSITADYYGTKGYGLNYGIVFSAYGVAGILGAVVAGQMVKMTGSYETTFQIMAVICFVAAALTFVTKSPQATALKASKDAEAKAKKAKADEDEEEEEEDEEDEDEEEEDEEEDEEEEK